MDASNGQALQPSTIMPASKRKNLMSSLSRPQSPLPASPHRPRPRDAGFSLLELMVVVVILSILALVVVPRVIDRPDQARAARAQADIAAISSAVQLYRLDNFRYPITEQGLAALVTRPVNDPVPANWAENGYMDRVPADPWGQPYQYLSPGVHGDFDIFSYGANGVAGGSGADQDIGSWSLE